MRNGGDLVAFLVVVGEGAGLEHVPEVEVAQLDFGAEADVAGEQAEHGRLRQGLQSADELPHARAELGLGSRAGCGRARRRSGRRSAGNSPAWAGSGGSRRTRARGSGRCGRRIQALEPVRGVELGGEDLGKSLHARAARVDQRAVNVEENQADHAPGSRRRSVRWQ